MSGRGSRTAGRAQSETLGFVLLIALVLMGVVAVLATGGIALDGLRDQVGVADAETSMREIDSRLSKVSYSDRAVQLLGLGSGPSQEVVVQNRSTFALTINGNGSCRVEVEMGSIVNQVTDRTEVAYEGGGVWKQTGDSTTVVSPPALQVQNGTVNFPVVSVSGTVDGSVDSLRALRNTTESQAQNREIQRTFARCRPVSNVTMSVTSDYYTAWGRYFDQRMDSRVTVDDANRTASVEIVRVGSTLNIDPGNNTISSSRGYEATVEILDTAGSVDRGWPGDGTRAKLNDPFSVRLVAGGEVLTPWRDGDPDDDFQFFEDNPNDPGRPAPSVRTVEVGEGEDFSVAMAIHNCRDGSGGSYEEDHWRDTGIDTDYEGGTYSEYVCDLDPDDVDDDIQVEINSLADRGSYNLVIREGGESIPGPFDNRDFQPSIRDILSGYLTADDELALADNQVVFIYELSSEVSEDEYDDCTDADASTSCGYDFNDAVVLVTFSERGSVDSFDITVTIDSVRVTDDEE